MKTVTKKDSQTFHVYLDSTSIARIDTIRDFLERQEVPLSVSMIIRRAVQVYAERVTALESPAPADVKQARIALELSQALRVR